MRSPRRCWLLLATLAVAAGCDVPRFTGPQIQEPPPSFRLQPEATSPRPTLPDREVVFHTAWVHREPGGVSAIYVDGHPGVLGSDDVVSAREAVMAAEADDDAVFGALESIRVDGRDAWGWSERVRSEPSQGVEVTYRAVVPYDSLTYAIEFVSDQPVLVDAAPDTLRAVVSTFGIGRPTWDIPVILVTLGEIVFMALALRSRGRTDGAPSAPSRA